MPDPDLLTLCDALVTALGEAEFSETVDCSWQPDPELTLEDAPTDTPLLWVVDLADLSETPNEFAVPVSEHEVLLVLQRKIGEGEVVATVARAMAGLVGEVQRFCRAAVIDEASCVRIRREAARDFADIHNRLFRAEIVTTWRRAG